MNALVRGRPGGLELVGGCPRRYMIGCTVIPNLSLGNVAPGRGDVGARACWPCPSACCHAHATSALPAATLPPRCMVPLQARAFILPVLLLSRMGPCKSFSSFLPFAGRASLQRSEICAAGAAASCVLCRAVSLEKCQRDMRKFPVDITGKC